MQTRNKTSERIKTITAAAMFCALAYICTFFLKFPVRFLTLDVKDSLIILSSLLFGPVTGLCVAVIVPILEFLTISDTGVYGLIMNMLSSVTFTALASVIYRYKKSMAGAVIGLLSGVLGVTAVMLLANMLITPYYMGVSTEAVIELIPALLLPFNLVKSVLNGAIVLLLYKPLSNVLKKTGLIRGGNAPSADTPKRAGVVRTVLVTGIAVCIIAASLAIIFFVLAK